MAAADFDIKADVGINRAQTSRRVEIVKEIDFSTINGGAGLAATEQAAFMDTPAGFVYEGHSAILKTAEGEAATLNIGTEAKPQGFVAAGDVNGNVGETIAKGANTINPGTYLPSTEIRVGTPAAANTVDVAVVKVTLYGHIIDYD